MKRLLLTIIGLFLMQTAFAQEWHSINSKSNESYSTQLIKSTDKSVVIDFSLNGFFTNPTSLPNSFIITNDDMAPLAEAGQPNVPSLSIPIIINDFDKMEVRVKKLEYQDYNFEIAPSKGEFPRSINPDDVPFTYDSMYQQDAFYPSENVKLDSPYILRDFRAQNIIVTPFSYNPISKTLRVYHKMTIEVLAVEGEGENVINRRSNTIRMNAEYENIYASRFINYKEANAKYNIIEEEGDLLVICHDAFMEAMQPFVDWKNSIGRKTTMVGTSVAGTSADNIKNYISTQYSDNSSLTYILLVGDYAQLPGKFLNMTGGYYEEYSGYSDWWFGQLTGDDRYCELIIGRFSAETTSDVTTQVNKVINYEKEIDSSATWIKKGQGVSHKEGQTGHNGEDDYQHIDKIREDLLGYNYTTVHRDYSNVSGVTSSAAIISQHINEGVSIINYCNHGLPTGWAVFNYGNSHVNALTNDYKLPFIISVACNNGEYTYYTPCFAETWLRATNASTGNPTGAIGGMFSYISQPWTPPMYGQDEMVDIFVESYSNNIKRTMGGVSLHGNFKLLDLGHNSLAYYATFNTWHLFGDPTLTLRTDTPETMTVEHYDEMAKMATAFAVTADNAEGALATLSRNGEMMGTALIENGTATIFFDAPMELGEATLTVFGYNKVTYHTTIDIVETTDQPLVVNVTANRSVLAPGSSAYLNAIAYGGSYDYTYSWTPTTGMNGINLPNPIVSPTETTTYTCTVNDGNITESASITIVVVTPPTNVEAEVDGNNVNLTWTETVDGATYNIYRNNNRIASGINATSYTDDNLSEGQYIYKVTSVLEDVESQKSEEAEAVVYEMTVTTFANPGFIVKGESTTIYANAVGATGDVTYSWTPIESLDTPNASSSVATPTETTIYTVTATSGSQTATATLKVDVLVEPVNVTAEYDGEVVTVKWDAVELADYYVVSRDGSVYNSYVSTTSFVDDDLNAGNYCYTVQSVHSALVSPHSEEACVDIDNDCVAPKNITAEFYEYDGEFGALVEWDKQESSVELTEFRIYRSIDNVDYKLIGNLVNVPSMTHYQYSDMNNTNGTYYYKVSAYYSSNDCESDFGMAENSDNDYVVVDVNSVDENYKENVNVYPNPVNNKLNIKANQIKSLTIVNMMGQSVLRQEVDVDEFVLDVSSLDSGMYLLNVETENGIVTRQINVVK